MIDFHCHLDLYPNPSNIASECKKRGIYVLSVTTTPSAWRGTSGLAGGAERIRTALGLHPQIAHERISELNLFDQFLKETRYVGEIGLDGSPEFRRHWDKQITVFEHILTACSNVGGRIMSIHSKRATKPVLERLGAYPLAGTPVLHWFSGSKKDLIQAVELECWFSVGPAMLRSVKGRELVSYMPRDHILTETDGPFANLDGKTLVPWDVTIAICELSKIWAVSESEAEKHVANNLRQLVAK